MVSDPLTDAPLPSRPSPWPPRFADADRLPELRDLLPGRAVLARRDRPVGALRPLPARSGSPASPAALAAVTRRLPRRIAGRWRRRPTSPSRRPPLPARTRSRTSPRPTWRSRQHLPETVPAVSTHRRPSRRLAGRRLVRPRPRPAARARCRSTPRWRRASMTARRRPPTPRSRGHRDLRRPPARAGKRRARRSRWPLPGLPTAILALVGAQCRADRLARRGRAPAAADGLALCGDRPAGQSARPRLRRASRARRETQDGVPVLVVEGTIVSTSGPRRRGAAAALRGAQSAAATRSTPGPRCRARSVLAPGDTLPFRSRLASPPPEAHDVLVRFFNRRDLVAGVQ